MRKLRIFTLLCTTVVTASLHANETSESKFNAVDDLLQAMKANNPALVEAPVKSVQSFPIMQPPLATNTTQPSQTAPGVVSVATMPESSAFNETIIAQAKHETKSKDKSHLSVRFTEMPPHAKFEFTRKVFIPAYKAGVILHAGNAALNIDDINDLPKILNASDDTKETCAILSDKSYVMMSAASDGKPATFLTVSRIEVKGITDTLTQKTRMAALVHFDGKKSAANDTSVNISLACLIPESFADNVYEYRLTHLDESLQGLFDISLPRFIEL